VIDGSERAEAFGQAFALDHRFHVDLTRDVWEINVRGHAGAETIVIVW
jgi:hypothetical protein